MGAPPSFQSGQNSQSEVLEEEEEEEVIEDRNGALNANRQSALSVVVHDEDEEDSDDEGTLLNVTANTMANDDCNGQRVAVDDDHKTESPQEALMVDAPSKKGKNGTIYHHDKSQSSVASQYEASLSQSERVEAPKLDAMDQEIESGEFDGISARSNTSSPIQLELDAMDQEIESG